MNSPTLSIIIMILRVQNPSCVSPALLAIIL